MYRPTMQSLLTDDFYMLNDDMESYSFFKFRLPSPEITIKSEVNGLPVTTIAKFAFYDCAVVTKVVLPDTITTIDGFSFSGCRSLRSINIPDGVTYIGEQAFRNCRRLTQLVIPKSVEDIDKFAFYECYSLRKIYYEGSKRDWNRIIKDYTIDSFFKELIEEGKLEFVFNYKL